MYQAELYFECRVTERDVFDSEEKAQQFIHNHLVMWEEME